MSQTLFWRVMTRHLVLPYKDKSENCRRKDPFCLSLNVPYAYAFTLGDMSATEKWTSSGFREMGRDSGHSSIRGSRQSKWGACFQQMASSLKCQACWVWCPNSCVGEGELGSWHTPRHTHRHTILFDHVKRGSSPRPNLTQFIHRVSFLSSEGPFLPQLSPLW